MFYEPKTLIVVYKDEMLANQIKKLIETKDDTDGGLTGTRDSSINVVTWTEKIWLANKKAGNITSKVLFLVGIKGVDSLIPVVDLKFEQHGVRYGWAGNQAVIYADPGEIKTIDSYYAFYTELKSMPVPQAIKDASKPKTAPIKEQPQEEVQQESEEKKGFFAKGKDLLKKVEDTIVDGMVDMAEKASIFTEENFRNKKAVKRQMLFYGVTNMYNEGLEIFMNA